MKKIYISSDHAGFKLKEAIKDYLSKKKINFQDLGPNNSDRVDYPDFAHKVARKVKTNKKNVGILVCGSGMGMSIAANRKKGIRAGLATNSKIARLIRCHNDANVLVLPGRFINTSEAKKSVRAFISTKFESGRHKKRINKN